MVDLDTSSRPDLILFFETSEDSPPLSTFTQLQNHFPDTPVVGCSTGTLIDGPGLADTGAVAMAIGFEHTRVKVATQAIGNACDGHAIGLALGNELAGNELAGIFVLSDGLNINGSALVAGLTEATGTSVSLSGGLAGDGARFAQTSVFASGTTDTRQVAAIGFYGTAIRLAHGSAGGWNMFGPQRLITRSEGNILYELDGKPALDLYERYLGEEAANLPASALLYPLQISFPDDSDHEIVRTILSIDPIARSMTFAGDMPQGGRARLMRGRIDALVECTVDAVHQALVGMQGLQPALCLTVSCVGRRLLLGQRTEEETQMLSNALGAGVDQIGFYSYGEIAPHPESGQCRLHNQTVALTLLAEVA